MRIGLDHVHIFSKDLSVTVEFFQRMFDAALVWDEDAAGVRIETDDLDQLVARMKSNGHEFFQGGA